MNVLFELQVAQSVLTSLFLLRKSSPSGWFLYLQSKNIAMNQQKYRFLNKLNNK
jgi:hypothetical protein